MHTPVLTCPPVGHKLFEKSLPQIVLGDTEKPEQITKFIRPASCVEDGLGIVYQTGELQRIDLQAALQLFAYPRFIATTFNLYRDRFQASECRIYQFQSMTPASGPFVFGMFITDDRHQLLEFCVDQPNTAKRKTILLKLIRAICTADSVAAKLNH